ncbi:MAG: hypothetical protein IKD34_03510 [Oscillospiraceae bacterium]|nr:hypothetical protein [Oscillospiraceae bacterium]
MKKKILSLLLAVVLLASTMVVALAEPKEIVKFRIFAGTMASKMDSFSVYFYVAEDDYYSGSTSAVEYYNITDDRAMAADENFEEGKTYRASFSIRLLKDRYTVDNPQIILDKGGLAQSPWTITSWTWADDADAKYLQLVLEGSIPGDDSSSSEDDTSSAPGTSQPNSGSSAPAEPEETTPTVPSVRPGNGSGEEEVIWQWSDSQKTEGQKNNPSTGDDFKTAVSVLMAAATLAGVGMLLGKKR